MIFNGLSAEVEGNKIQGYIIFGLGLRLTAKNPYRLKKISTQKAFNLYSMNVFAVGFIPINIVSLTVQWRSD